MKKQILSKGLYIEGLRKLKIPSFIFLAIIVLIQGIIPLLANASNYGPEHSIVISAVDFMGATAIVPVLMAPVLTLIVFYAFNNRSSSDHYQSLPYTRQCLFFSWTLSVLSISCALIITGGLCGYLSRVIFDKYLMSFTGLGFVLLGYIAALLFSVACVLVAVSVTGTFLSNVACALLLMFLPRFIMVLVRDIVMQAVPVLEEGHFLPWMAYSFNAFIMWIVGAAAGLAGNLLGIGLYHVADISLTDSMVIPSVFTIVIALIYTALAVILFMHRKSETAGQGGSNRIVQHIIRIGLTFTVSLLGTAMIIGGLGRTTAVIMYFIALIVFFAYEIITTKKWINLVKILPTLLIVAALNVCVWGATEICSNYILNENIPADDISSVRITGLNGSSYFYSDKSDEIEITDPEARRIVSEALDYDLKAIREDRYHTYWSSSDSNGMHDYIRQYTVAISTDTGTVYRNLRLSDKSVSSIGAILAQTEEFRNAFLSIPDAGAGTLELSVRYNYNDRIYYNEGEFPPQAAAELFATAKNEIAGQDFQEWFDYTRTSEDQGTMAGNIIEMAYVSKGLDQYYIRIPLSMELTPESYRYAYDLIKQCQNLYPLEYILTNKAELDGIDAYYYMNGEVFYTDENGQEQSGFFDLYSHSVEAYEGGLDAYGKSLAAKENTIVRLLLEAIQAEEDESETEGTFLEEPQNKIVLYYSFEPYVTDVIGFAGEDDADWDDYGTVVLPLDKELIEYCR